MYYRSKKRKVLKWLFNNYSKIYLPILLVLGILVYVSFKNMNASGEASADNNNVNNNDVTSGVSSTEEESSSVTVTDTYQIKVNKSLNFISINKQDPNSKSFTAFKVFRCSVNSNVPTGNYQISEKYVWRLLDNHVYGQYTSRIGTTYYIHSVPYSNQSSSSLITDAYNNIGNPATIGSIYLYAADAKWIYENCKNSTTVEVYENNTEQPAIALGEKETLPYGAAFDPSDVSNGNKKVQTKIDYLSGVKDKQVAVGTSINLWDGIYAADMQGNNITNYVTITGSVDTSVPGRYTVTYNLVDTYGTVIAYNSIINVY